MRESILWFAQIMIPRNRVGPKGGGGLIFTMEYIEREKSIFSNIGRQDKLKRCVEASSDILSLNNRHLKN